MINSPFNKLGQKLFGINDRQSVKNLARKDTIAIFYRGRYVEVRIETPADFAKDKKFINMMLETLGFKR